MRLGPTVQDILLSTHATTLAIASAATIYTASFIWGSSEYFALDYIASSNGTVALKIEIEQSNTLPGTEGSTDTNWVVAENMQDVESALADKTQHFKKLSPVVSKYGRLKITGGGGNDAITTLRAKLVRQEQT